MTMPQPIACSLSPEALTDRIDWIRALNGNCLRTYSLDRAMLRLTYDAAAGRDVHALVARERECCGFLHFEIQESDDTIELCISADDSEEMNLEALFAPFIASAPQR